MYQLKAHGVDYPFCWLEQRLKPLGFRLVFVTRTLESFESARAERLKGSGNPGQYADLQVFVEEQKLMRKLVKESILPTLELDISNNNIDGAVEQIADWMESTGGLWMIE